MSNEQLEQEIHEQHARIVSLEAKNDSLEDELSSAKRALDDLNNARKQVTKESEILLKALEEIKREQGKVCGHFDICSHAACRSSYSSWAIADEVLRKV